MEFKKRIKTSQQQKKIESKLNNNQIGDRADKKNSFELMENVWVV